MDAESLTAPARWLPDCKELLDDDGNEVLVVEEDDDDDTDDDILG